MDLQAFKTKFKDFTSRLFQKNKYERILKDHILLSEDHPGDKRIQIKIAETYFKAKDVDKAIQTYQNIAEAYVEEKFILKAASIYKNILKLDPTLVEINLRLAELYLKLDMLLEAVTQYRIVMQNYTFSGEKEKLIEICKTLVEIDSSPDNRRKLAEIYQAQGLTVKAIEQYEILAKTYRMTKQYDSLLHIYELILAHKPENTAMIKDVCILHLRRQDPDNAIRTMERYKVSTSDEFVDFFNKAKSMRQALRAPKPTTSTPSISLKKNQE